MSIEIKLYLFFGLLMVAVIALYKITNKANMKVCDKCNGRLKSIEIPGEIEMKWTGCGASFDLTPVQEASSYKYVCEKCKKEYL
jgi:uncharacterized protein with PIN domain